MLLSQLFLAALVLIIACRSPANDANASRGPQRVDTPVALRLDRSAYRPGDTVRLTLTNGSRTTYVYNPCTRILQRNISAAWETVERDRICTMEAWMLAGNDSASATTTLPKALPSGTYRFVLALTAEGGMPDNAARIDAVSPTFTVAP